MARFVEQQLRKSSVVQLGVSFESLPVGIKRSLDPP